ncbi:hypothetical protein NP233_g2606 [Leucocoprinus birnbaumii]|uniref:Uncharacterized protein n=1 Tax=Leucocoprinus birnbaumii TaxID=56174 RepID=A0AAD5VY41_9AGAR|nr:hypothetical protein NP233_g2606 [Leucocoprinus birnbaumii]
MSAIDKGPIQYTSLQPLHLERCTTLAALEAPSDTYADAPLLANDSPRVPHNRHKGKLYARGFAFVLFELVFLVFAYYTLLHPIPLQNTPQEELVILSSFSVTVTEMKAGITAMAVVWHMIACLFVKDVIAVVCSAEFMTQYRRSGALIPGKSDRVSTMTSGTIDNVVHCFGNSASREFQLAFMTTLVLIVVGPLGSGTVTIGTLSNSLKKPISVAGVQGQWGLGLDDIINQANAIMRLEGYGNTLFGYKMSSDNDTDTVLIPWPKIDVEELAEGGHLVYNSDIVLFHYECSWVPRVNFISPNASQDITLQPPLSNVLGRHYLYL